jgi:hypothetical protein
MKTNTNSVSYRVALGGIVSALCLLSMFLAGVMPMFYVLLPMVAGAMMMIIVIEVSWQWAFITYIAVGLLSMFVCFDKEAAILFIVLFGHYPILKYLIDNKLSSKKIAWFVKFFIYNFCMVSYFLICVYILGSKELLKEIQKYFWWIILLIDFLFLTYDPSLDTLTEKYTELIKPKLQGKRKRGRR